MEATGARGWGRRPTGGGKNYLCFKQMFTFSFDRWELPLALSRRISCFLLKIKTKAWSWRLLCLLRWSRWEPVFNTTLPIYYPNIKCWCYYFWKCHVVSCEIQSQQWWLSTQLSLLVSYFTFELDSYQMVNRSNQDTKRVERESSTGSTGSTKKVAFPESDQDERGNNSSLHLLDQYCWAPC